MAELADAADSKSAGTWYLGGSTPPPGTTQNPNNYADLAASCFRAADVFLLVRFAPVPNFVPTCLELTGGNCGGFWLQPI